jgi:amidohydrolase
MKEMAVSLVKGMGGKCAFKVLKGYPVLINEGELTRNIRHHAEGFLGKDKVVELDLWMAAEDFAFYSQKVPGCYYRLGIGNDAAGVTSGLHTSTFNIDEQALETGPGLMAYLALKSLGN